MCEIILFPGRGKRRKALGKHPASNRNDKEQARTILCRETPRFTNTPTHAPATFHMEVTIKLTMETIDAR